MFTVTFTMNKAVSKPPLFFPRKNHLIWWHGDELDLALNILGLGNHPVLVGHPVAILLHILLHSIVLCVEDVATISEHTQEEKIEKKDITLEKNLQRSPDPVFINIVVTISSNVWPFIYDQALRTIRR